MNSLQLLAFLILSPSLPLCFTDSRSVVQSRVYIGSTKNTHLILQTTQSIPTYQPNQPLTYPFRIVYSSVLLWCLDSKVTQMKCKTIRGNLFYFFHQKQNRKTINGGLSNNNWGGRVHPPPGHRILGLSSTKKFLVDQQSWNFVN